MVEISNESQKNLYRAGLTFLIVLSLFFVVKILSEMRAYGMMGGSESRVITLTGHGEVSAVPDIANVYFTIRKDGPTVKEAQDAVAKVEASALESLKANGVEDKDVQAANASFNPKYEYRYSAKSVPCTAYGCPPRQGSNVVVGYEAYESITVKVRNTDTVGKIMQDLGTLGVTDLNGPNFAIDDEEELKAEARKEAIEDARAKAKVLAKDLGVRLGRVANYSENGNYPMPMYYGKDAMMEQASSGAATNPASLPKGENTITSDVTITYEIK